jgi:hypothetical protein
MLLRAGEIVLLKNEERGKIPVSGGTSSFLGGAAGTFFSGTTS